MMEVAHHYGATECRVGTKMVHFFDGVQFLHCKWL